MYSYFAVSDATVLIRDIAADASQKAANQIRPSEEQLSQIDAPAEENVWHEKPNLSKEEMKSRLKQKTVGLPSLASFYVHTNFNCRTNRAVALHLPLRLRVAPMTRR